MPSAEGPESRCDRLASQRLGCSEADGDPAPQDAPPNPPALLCVALHGRTFKVLQTRACAPPPASRGARHPTNERGRRKAGRTPGASAGCCGFGRALGGSEDRGVQSSPEDTHAEKGVGRATAQERPRKLRTRRCFRKGEENAIWKRTRLLQLKKKKKREKKVKVCKPHSPV